jgi:hypothetical protein
MGETARSFIPFLYQTKIELDFAATDADYGTDCHRETRFGYCWGKESQPTSLKPRSGCRMVAGTSWLVRLGQNASA